MMNTVLSAAAAMHTTFYPPLKEDSLSFNEMYIFLAHIQSCNQFIRLTVSFCFGCNAQCRSVKLDMIHGIIAIHVRMEESHRLVGQGRALSFINI